MKANLIMITAMNNKEVRGLSEKEFSVAIREFAESHGWLVHYQGRTGGFGRDGVTWRSNAPKGFPDMFMVRAERAVAAELKRQSGSTTPEQRAWLSALGETCVESYLWKPADASEIVEALR